MPNCVLRVLQARVADHDCHADETRMRSSILPLAIGIGMKAGLVSHQLSMEGEAEKDRFDIHFGLGRLSLEEASYRVVHDGMERSKAG